MKQAFLIFSLLTLLALTSSAAIAQNGGYLVTNDNNASSNSATAFTVTSDGKMSIYKTLQTGGTGLGGGYFAEVQTSIESNAHCLFVADSGSNDIAAFEGPTFKRVSPNFSNSQLQGNLYGIALAVDPAGKFLYTAWTASQNIAVLAIASDCSLSLVGTPISQPDALEGLTVTHNGKILGASYPNIGGVQAYNISSTGALTPLGPQLSFNSAIADCASVGCYPSGQDATDDGLYWVWGNGTLAGPYTLSAKLTSTGFTNAALQSYDSKVVNLEAPWFSPQAAQTHSGNLYIGASGFGPGNPAGIIVATFNNGTITYDSEVVNTAALFAGAIQTVGTMGTGSPLVQIVEESEAILISYTVDGTTLRQASTLPDPKSPGTFSMAAFPKRP